MGWDVPLIKRQHSKWLSAYDAEMRASMLEIGAVAVAEAHAQKFLKNRTFAFYRGWQRAFRSSKSSLTIALQSRVPHATYHEFGTGIYGPKHHRIYPVRAKCLRWVNPDTGQVHFARSVRGVKPRWIGRTSSTTAYHQGKRILRITTAKLARRF